MSHILRLRLAAAAFAAFAVNPLTAGTLTYTTYAGWQADSTSLFALDFSKLAIGNTTTATGSISGGAANSNLSIGSQVFYNNLNGYYNNDFQIIGTSGPGFFVRQTYASTVNQFHWATQGLLTTETTSAFNSVSMRVNFRNGGLPTAVSAFAVSLGLGGNFGSSGNITVTPQGLGAQTVTTLNQASGLQFFGVSSDTQTFSYFDITITDPNGRFIVLDNLSSGTSTITTAPPPPPPPTETPDAATLLTVGTGLAYLGYLRRNRQLDMA